MPKSAKVGKALKNYGKRKVKTYKRRKPNAKKGERKTVTVKGYMRDY